jgi:predicted nucleic acid-binding protein
LREADWLEVVPLQDPGRADLIADLERGEAEVLALAQERNADLVIIDERLARRHANRLGMRLTGTLGMLLKAKQLGMIEAVAPVIDQLRQGGIRLGDDVVTEVLRLAGER